MKQTRLREWATIFSFDSLSMQTWVVLCGWVRASTETKSAVDPWQMASRVLQILLTFINSFGVVFVRFEFSHPPSLHVSSFILAPAQVLWTPDYSQKAGLEHSIACRELSTVPLEQRQS
jgi:hypothetical protein